LAQEGKGSRASSLALDPSCSGADFEQVAFSACPVKWLQVSLAQAATKKQAQMNCRVYGFHSPEAKICRADLI
jgi:hypothetical protein